MIVLNNIKYRTPAKFKNNSSYRNKIKLFSTLQLSNNLKGKC